MRRFLDWVRGHVWGLIVGATVTLLTAELHVAGFFQKLDLLLLDLKFQHFNSVAAHHDLVMIDINDYALERVHAWPWPRRLHADLVDTLSELGAKAVLMDIVFSEPTPGRLDDPRLEPDHGVDPAAELRGEISWADAIFDDAEFAAALRRAGNVYLATFARLYDPRFNPETLREQVRAVLETSPRIRFTELDSRLGGAIAAFANHGRGEGREARVLDPRELATGLRLEWALEKNFLLDEYELSEQLTLPLEDVRRHLAGAKRSAARRLVRAFRRERPDDATWAEVFAGFFPDRAIDDQFADREDLLRAYRAVSAERVTTDRAFAVPQPVARHLRYAEDLTLPVEQLAAAAQVGLVAYETDKAGGVMRRLPLMVNVDGRLLKHLGFAVAADVLDIDEGSIHPDVDGTLVMTDRAAERTWRVPLDDDGRTLIQWHIDADAPIWTRSFLHLPISEVMRIPDCRRKIAHQEGWYRQFLGEIVSTVCEAQYGNYEKLVREQNSLRQAPGDDAADERRRELDTAVAAIEDSCVRYLVDELAPQIRAFLASPQAAEADPAEASSYKRQVALAEDAAAETTRRKTRATQERLRQALDRTLGELKPRIAGKICLVGYTATAVADTVNSPVFDEMPGVLAHANVLNSFLQNQFPRSAPLRVNAGIILLGGLVLTLVTTLRDPWISLLSVLLTMVILVGTALALFFTSLTHIDVVGAVIGAFVVWAFVTLYRQLVEERQKRAFTKALAQYTSPAIAAQRARRSRNFDMAPQRREVTCFFSDLKGFTSISERLGAARTRDVLNPYLEAMSEVLIASSAMINKFMGDGIFAYYNPPILPVADHGRAACLAALDCFEALDALKQRLAGGDLEHDVRALSMRIGLNSGEVFVGDYGSGYKTDYTCIGDTVNLAARLEPACKVFGVRALVSESTKAAAGDGFAYRHLGGLQVVGKTRAVQVYELLGRSVQVEQAAVAYAEQFAAAVAAFARRDWQGALGALQRCRGQRPDDLASDVLEANVRAFETHPPPNDWNQAIELTSK